MATSGVHHVAYATRDIEATRHFYEDLMGFPLVYSEVQQSGTAGLKHLFFDAGNGACIAFFEVNGVGETADYSTNVSEAVGLPFWVNHCAFGATAEKQDQVKAAMAAEGILPVMDLDHGWCHSVYFLDPSGVMVELCRDTPGFEPDRAGALETLGLDA